MLLKKIGSFIIIVLAVITFFTCSDGDGDVNDNGYVPGKFKLANSWGIGGSWENADDVWNIDNYNGSTTNHANTMVGYLDD
jgi:hypothetical protein